MVTWTQDELQRINDSDELQIAAVRADGTVRGPRPIWVVPSATTSTCAPPTAAPAAGTARRAPPVAPGSRPERVEKDVAVEDADEGLFDQVDAAYRSKYGERYASIVADITDAEHRASTLKLIPAGDEP